VGQNFGAIAMHDVLTNVEEKTIKCLGKGFVQLVDAMPRLVPDTEKTADYAIAEAARVSYGDGTKTVNENRGLIRYLLRHAHTTPFEMIEFKFLCKMPIFIARQWIRHRTANVNEYSGRYSVMKDEFYIPELSDVKIQSNINKQGGDQQADSLDAQGFLGVLNDICDKAYAIYEEYNAKGFAREQSRMILPVNNYTQWYWKIDLHNLLHFLALRCDSHAQMEIRVFADAMLSLITPIVPIAIEAWNDYHPMRGAMKLTRLEVDALKKYFGWTDEKTAPPIESTNNREQAEWEKKAAALGLRIMLD
jgi:thymidylate synthase (FAD)